MLTVGITGGIGSGKTTVCRVFSALGVPVFQADLVARRLQEEDAEIIRNLKKLFGEAIYTPENLLDRKKLAAIIFSDQVYLEKVNGLVHPAVHQKFEEWKMQMKDSAYVLYEAAILFETGSYRNFDFNILVTADENERIERVIKRDHTSREAILNRINHQMKDSEKRGLADFVLENNDNQMIIPEILKLDQIIKAKSHVWKMDR